MITRPEMVTSQNDYIFSNLKPEKEKKKMVEKMKKYIQKLV